MSTPARAYRSMAAWPATKIRSKIAETGLALGALSLSPWCSWTWVSWVYRMQWLFFAPWLT